jgi:hypothetical protein
MRQAKLTKTVTIRFTPGQWETYSQFALKGGYSGVADLLRQLADKHCQES